MAAKSLQNQCVTNLHEAYALSCKSSATLFLQIFSDTLNKHAPLRKRSRKEEKLYNKPWITKGIMVSSKNKTKLYVASLKGTSKKLNLYKKYRNTLAHVKELAKKNYYSQLIDSTKHNVRLLWKTINSITKFTKTSSNYVTELHNESSGEKLTDHAKISNMFNKYFSEIGQKMASKIARPSSCDSPIKPLNLNQKNSFYFKPVTESDVLTHINQLNPMKSAGPEGIPLKFIKMTAPIITPVLVQIFNKCVVNGIYPNCLKTGQIIPIHKSGPKNLCSNYRPISLLSPFSKIFEKCIYDQLYWYFEKFKLLSPDQFGFKKNCSSAHAVRQLCDSFVENLDDKKSTCAIFLDLSKAFDTVDHHILIKKLEQHGIRGLPLQLLKSYLTCRFQYTLVNGVKSNLCQVMCGVPQGSTLGPLLFLIYINDLPHISKFKTKLFADDTVLTLSNSCITRLHQEVNEELKHIDNWMKFNKLSINYHKTKCMLITGKHGLNTSKDFNIYIGKHELERVNEIKYLGVIFDDKITWKPQIKQLCTKLSCGSWALLKLRNYVNLSTLKSVYYSLIYSHLQYCISTWGLASKTALNPLEKLHKRIVRIMTNSSYLAHTKPLFYKLNFLKINDICHLEIAKYMFQQKNKSDSFHNFNLTTHIHKHNTRLSSKHNYFISRKRTEKGKKSFSYAGCKIWEDVPEELKHCSFNQFKKKLKLHLISKYFQS